MMVLTNAPLRKKRASLCVVVGAYVTRWPIEGLNRSLKHGFQLQDMRIMR